MVTRVVPLYLGLTLLRALEDFSKAVIGAVRRRTYWGEQPTTVTGFAVARLTLYLRLALLDLVLQDFSTAMAVLKAVRRRTCWGREPTVTGFAVARLALYLGLALLDLLQYFSEVIHHVVQIPAVLVLPFLLEVLLLHRHRPVRQATVHLLGRVVRFLPQQHLLQDLRDGWFWPFCVFALGQHAVRDRNHGQDHAVVGVAEAGARDGPDGQNGAAVLPAHQDVVHLAA